MIAKSQPVHGIRCRVTVIVLLRKEHPLLHRRSIAVQIVGAVRIRDRKRQITGTRRFQTVDLAVILAFRAGHPQQIIVTGRFYICVF